MDKKFLEIAGEYHKISDFAYTKLNDKQLRAAAYSLNPLNINTGQIPAYDLIRIMATPTYLWWAAKILLGITLTPMQAVVLEELWTRQFPMMVCSRGFSKCITKDTISITERGILSFEEILDLKNKEYEPLKHINHIEKFYGENGWNTTDYAFYNGKTPTKKIKTDLGLELEGAYNHPIRVLRNGQHVWVELQNLSVGDLVVIKTSSVYLNNQCNEINQEIAYNIGVSFIGDEIPIEIRKSGSNNIRAFLSGLFSKDKEKYITKSKYLVQQIQSCLLSLGILSYNKSYDDIHILYIYNFFLTTTTPGGNYYSNIVDIQDSSNDTYDIHIPHDHSFITNGMISHNTFLLAVYTLLRLRLVPGTKIVVCGAAYRQSKFVFNEAVKIFENTGDVYRSTCSAGNGPRVSLDKCSFYVGSSEAHFMPVGSGDTIRGMRAHTVIMDEFGSVNPEIYEVVIAGFGAVAKNPIESMNEFYKRQHMIQEGTWTENMENAFIAKGGNQSILSGTCTYDFEHFAKYWKTYKAIIESRGDKEKLNSILGGGQTHTIDWRHYSIIRIPYELIPGGIMDANTIARSKANMTADSYSREYGAVFSKDSAGFIKSSLIKSCMASPRNAIEIGGKTIIYSAKIHGDKNLKYVFGVDPASEVDNLAITILELHPDHTRVVYCWTINRKKHQAKIEAGIAKEHDYFQYCVEKIRELMVVFPCVGIYMDAQGGGRTLQQALATPRDGSTPIYETIEEGEKKITDDMHGLHILTMCQFANAKWTAEANHGLKYDFEQKLLLLPDFDSVVLAIAHQEDKKRVESMGIKYEDTNIEENIGLYDTLEDCVFEIEKMKEEIASIVHTKTQTGVERWDTPDTKIGIGRKGKTLHKDRYSALVMANMGARTTGRLVATPPAYKVMGMLAGQTDSKKKDKTGSGYTSGPLAGLPVSLYGRPKR